MEVFRKRRQRAPYQHSEALLRLRRLVPQYDKNDTDVRFIEGLLVWAARKSGYLITTHTAGYTPRNKMFMPVGVG